MGVEICGQDHWGRVSVASGSACYVITSCGLQHVLKLSIGVLHGFSVCLARRCSPGSMCIWWFRFYAEYDRVG